MSETFTPPFESEEPTGLTEPAKSSETITATSVKPDIKYDPEKKEIIILLEEDDTIVEKRHPFQEFMYRLRDEGVRVSTGEWLDLQNLLSVGEVQSLDELYIVSRAVLVKDATHFPQFDTVFGSMFYGIEPPSEKEEEDYDDYKEQEDTTDGDKEKNKKDEKETEDKEKKDTEEKKEDKKPEQKGKENIDEIEEATSMTSEEKHGGNEATKDIKNSPNPADNGENPDNKGAEAGLAGNEGGGEGEGGKNKSKLGTKGEGGKNKSGVGNKGGGIGGEGSDEVAREGDKNGDEETSEEKKSGSGKGKRKEKTAGGGTIRGGKGGYPSAREAIEERKYDFLNEDRALGYEQFGRALSKLRTIVQETTETKTRQLDAYATVKSIAQHGGSPELLWKEEVEEKPSVIILFDVGGSTDEFRPIMEKLFAASKDFLEGVEVYYFHNAIYDDVWPQKDGNRGKHFIPVKDLLKKEASTKVIVVGDAWMAEEEYFDTPAEESFKKLKDRFDSVVWINPIPEKEQDDMDNSGTIYSIRKVFSMHDLTLSGIERAVTELMEEK